jgi:hypothetical protein
MTDKVNPATRRSLLIGAATLAGLPILARPRAASAAGGTLPKTNAKYQDHPNGGNKCSGCVYWIPGAKPDAPGLCKVVAGPIAANAWCILYAPKPA